MNPYFRKRFTLKLEIARKNKDCSFIYCIKSLNLIASLNCIAYLNCFIINLLMADYQSKPADTKNVCTTWENLKNFDN